jgi:predicted RNase H-like HicB family nuclease
MRVLFDQGTPVPLRRYLTAHEVITAFDLGWGRLGNGELLDRAEQAGFEVLVTTDQNLKYPGCSAVGDSPEEAVREMGTAMRLWLEAARSMGRALPEPTDRAVAA